jgi:hypothetical protein
MGKGRGSALAVSADRLHRAAGQGFLAQSAFVVGLRLLVEVGVAAVVIALEVGWCRFAAKVAVDALVIDIIGSGGVLRVLVCSVSHEGLG